MLLVSSILQIVKLVFEYYVLCQYHEDTSTMAP